MSKEKNLSPALGLILIASGIFVVVSLLSYHPGDVGDARAPHAVFNYAGKLGAWLSLYLFLTTGYAAYSIPVFLAGEGIARLVPRKEPPRPAWMKLVYEALMVASLSPLLNEFPELAGGLGEQLARMGPGGWWGELAYTPLHGYLGEVGARLVLLTVFVVSGALLTEMKPLIFLAHCCRKLFSFTVSLLPAGRRVKVSSHRGPVSVRAPVESELPVRGKAEEARKKAEEARREAEEERLKEEKELKERLERERLIEAKRREKEERKRLKELKRQEKKEKREAPEPREKRTKAPVFEPAVPRPPARSVVAAGPGRSAYRLPSAELLTPPPPLSERELKDDIEVNSRILESTLLDFGLEVKVVGAERGPAITRYELQPAPGVKVGRIKALDNDIALAMKATSVRILAPIPGKAALGIEVPNSSTALVYMKEMIESPGYRGGSAFLPLAIGKDISGRAIVADLTEMPHFLIAGATGSGKTVCINSIIISLLFSRTPEELKLIMVDPKKVEMASFSRLPHLLCPVVTDPAKTSQALAWLVKEMENRYDLCSKAGVRNIQAYNNRKEPAPGEGGEEEELPATIPYIVLLIDELADLMLAASNEIENAIARLAHLSRAVGIHMILATQRPSVDVITGLIKANFPARISFKVAAKVDSRTVLDTGGADKLLGQGDLLFLPPGSDRLIRAQGTLCHDDEIEAVVGFVTRQGAPSFEQEIFQKGVRGAVALGGGEDVFLESAIEVIKQTDQASVSVLQRKLKIGYSRAARIMDILEERGIVGPYQGTKAREILIETYGGGQAEPDFDEDEDDE